MQTPARFLAATVFALALLATSACSDSGDDKASDTPTSPAASTETSDAAVPTVECKIDDIPVDGDFGVEPTITIPDGCSPPTALLSKDLVAGSGPGAQAGGTVLANYHLVTWSNKEVLDSSFSRGEPFPVENLGAAQVIAGWNQGLIGMKKGTRRLLVVPPDLGYGAGGNGVEPNETLVFVVDAVDVS